MRRALSGIALVALALGVARAEDRTSYRDVAAKAASLIESRWAERQKRHRATVPGDPPFPEGPAWSARATPPFPAVWPPDGKGRVMVYGFAAGMRPSLRDGEEVAAPWGRVVVERHALRFEDLGDLRRLGVHGVRPLAGEELRIARSRDAAAADLYALAHGAKIDPAQIKRYYRQWMRDSGLGPEMRRLHPAFSAWLEARAE